MARLIDIDGELLPRWWGIMKVLSELSEGDGEDFEETINPAQFANQLRGMLAQDKRTKGFHWSVKRNGVLISAEKLHSWKTPMEGRDPVESRSSDAS